MQIVRESINFTCGLDPKDAMEIGIFAPKEFEEIDDAVDYLIKYLPIILNTDKIPEDLVISYTKPQSKMTTEEYKNHRIQQDKINVFIRKTIKVPNTSTLKIKSSLFYGILKMGYKRYYDES
jgi:hypothetical protein